MQVNIIEKTKVDWNTEASNNNGFPGVEQMKYGYLQRIAAATEAMAQYHVQIIKDRDMYERWYKERGDRIRRLEKSNAALRGHIKRLKALSK